MSIINLFNLEGNIIISYKCENIQELYNKLYNDIVHNFKLVYCDKILSVNDNIIFNWMRYYLSNRDQGLQNVIVRPTDQQIENATELIFYDNSIPHSQCSITLEPFEEGEEICRIKHCLHCFKKDEIYNWFHTNVRCPVCRYDIREYRSPVIEEPENDPPIIVPTPLNNTNRILQEASVSPLMRSLQSTLQHIFSQTVPLEVDENDRQLLYTFDIPLSFDLSGNFRL